MLHLVHQLQAGLPLIAGFFLFCYITIICAETIHNNY